MKKVSEKTLEKNFSLFIRLRDANDQGICKCCTCGKYNHWKRGDAGHFITRDNKSTKYDEKNVNYQCMGCNRFKSGKQYEHSLFIDEKYGQGTAETIRIKSKSMVHRSWFDIAVLNQEYLDKVKQIKKEKGL